MDETAAQRESARRCGWRIGFGGGGGAKEDFKSLGPAQAGGLIFIKVGRCRGTGQLDPLLDLGRQIESEQAEKHGAEKQRDVAAVTVKFSRQWQAKYSVALLLFGSLYAGCLCQALQHF